MEKQKTVTKAETAYTRFYRARRLALLAQDPSLSFSQLSSLISSEWRAQRTTASTPKEEGDDAWAFLRQAPVKWPGERYSSNISPCPSEGETNQTAPHTIRLPIPAENGWRQQALAQIEERRRAVWVTPQEMLRGVMTTARRRAAADRHTSATPAQEDACEEEDVDEPVVVSTLSLSGSSTTSSDGCASSTDDEDDSLGNSGDSDSVTSSSVLSALLEDDSSVVTITGDDEEGGVEDDVVEDVDVDDGGADLPW